ncbi:MAG: hypothetical protein ACFFEA_01435 [Candidatus Thorarchaeota archaeon]
MSAARKAVDSTLRKVLIYTAEIIMSIILLIVICIPLAFGIPLWFQTVVFGVPSSELLINPLSWFGASGAFWITILLSLVSVFIGYILVYRLVPSADVEEEEEEPEEEEEEAPEEEDLEDEEESDDFVEDEELEVEDEVIADLPEEESD